MDRLSTKEGVIAALAIDQRVPWKMMAALGVEADAEKISQFKTLVSQELTPYASSILLDPEYGLAAAQSRDPEAGLCWRMKNRLWCDYAGTFAWFIREWSVERLSSWQMLSNLLYYDVDEATQINQLKHVFIGTTRQRMPSGWSALLLEVLSYDAKLPEVDSKAYAQRKPEKVIGLMKEFSKPQYKVDVLKVEVPVNMNYVAGFAKEETVHTKEEVAAYFKAQSDATSAVYFSQCRRISQLIQETLVCQRSWLHLQWRLVRPGNVERWRWTLCKTRDRSSPSG